MPQPKAHKYKKTQRLFHAKNWMKTYTGKKLHHGYAKHFGVSKLCAINELELLGVYISPELRAGIVRAEEDKRKQNEKRKAKKEFNFIDSDDYFGYIAGYTSGGAPYGLTCEEMREIEAREKEGITGIDENAYDPIYEIDENTDDPINEIEEKADKSITDEDFNNLGYYDDLPF